MIPPPTMYELNSIRTVTRDAIRYELDISCLMQWFVYWGLQDKMRQRLYSMAEPGNIVLDVGTNIGETLLNFGKIVGDSGRVYGFEPDDKNFAAVSRNVELNPELNVKVFNLGAGEKRDSLRLYRVDPNNRGMNRILSDDEAAEFDDYTIIELDTIDNVVKQNGIGPIDLIKIDIEGYEMHALRGAAETLRRDRPKLFIEILYKRLIKNGTSPNEIISFLKDHGYDIFNAETGEPLDADHNFSYLGDGGMDIYAIAG